MWFIVVLILLPVLVVAAGQLGAFRGRVPADLGASADGLLKPPAQTPNSVSSQAQRFADHPQRAYAQIEPITVQVHTPAEAIARLRAALVQDPMITVVRQTDRYLRAEARTRWMGYVDDLEFVVRLTPTGEPAPEQEEQLEGQLAEAHGSSELKAWTIDLRSASRLGRSDLGVNRARIEALRSRILAGG